MTYTLGMAARATGLSKSTIHRAIKDGRISATRTDAWSFAIDPAEVHRVFPPVQDATHSGNGSVTQDATPSERGEDALRHARLEAEINASLQVNALLCEQLHETRVDRERWREQAQQLVAAALAAPVTESGIRSRRLGFPARLMGLV
jgi:excisionase family DNA binding protein